MVLPHHLRARAGTGRVVEVEAGEAPTQRTVLDALEAAYPALGGTIRDRATQRRRPLVRFYACEEDLSDEEPDTPLPGEVVSGKEPFMIIGAMAGG